MKKKIPFICIILGAIFLVVGLVIPSSSDESGFINIARILPQDLGEFYFFNVEMLQSDEELQSTWSSVKDSYLENGIYGEDIGNVTALGLAGTDANISIYAGNFDLENVKLEIEQSSLESYEYEGVVIWIDQYDYGTAVIDNMIFHGITEDIRQCINVSMGNGASLYSDKDVSDVISRLPDGYLLGVVGVGEDDVAAEDYGLLGVGMAAFKDEGNVSQMSLLKFKDSEALEDYLDLVESSISEGYDVAKSGQYLTVSSTSPIPSDEEQAYNTVYNVVQNAVVVYYYTHNGSLPALNGTLSISGYDFKVVNICDLLTSEGGIIDDVPEGLASLSGPDNDNCDAADCGGCLNTNHYIWVVDDYGYVYSACVGNNCSEYNSDGFQGVWP